MLEIINVLLPIFALMGLGFLAVKRSFFPASGVNGLILFVNNFATPCLLFYSISTQGIGHAFRLDIIGSFYLAALFCFVTGIYLAKPLFGIAGRNRIVTGFTGTFTNTVLVGLPIITRAYGPTALPVTFSIIGVHAAILLTIGMLTMELSSREGASFDRALLRALRRVVSNPLIWGIAAGMTGALLDLHFAEPAAAFFTMMSSAVVPVSLFGIGGALAGFRLTESWQPALVATLIKLILHPVLVYLALVVMLQVPLEIARYAVLLSAMPAGVNVFVFASRYKMGTDVAANAILIGTVLSVLTLPVWLLILS